MSTGRKKKRRKREEGRRKREDRTDEVAVPSFFLQLPFSCLFFREPGVATPLRGAS
jgi:hypothetical protein